MCIFCYLIIRWMLKTKTRHARLELCLVCFAKHAKNEALLKDKQKCMAISWHPRLCVVMDVCCRSVLFKQDSSLWVARKISRPTRTTRLSETKWEFSEGKIIIYPRRETWNLQSFWVFFSLFLTSFVAALLYFPRY